VAALAGPKQRARASIAVFAGGLTTLALGAAPSHAAVTIGSNLAADANANISFAGGQPTHAHSVLPIASTAPGGVTAPDDGVVVRWRIKTRSLVTPVALRITRPGTSNTRTGAGTGPTVTPATNSTSSFDVRLPIKAGDALGIDCCEDAFLGAFSTLTGAHHRSWFPRLEDGASPRASFDANYELLMNADVEPDADSDGYGDETQDRCPGRAGPDGGCPFPSPPPPGGGGSEPPAPPELTLDAKNKQRVKRLKTEVGCGAVACSVDLAGQAKVPRGKRVAAKKKTKKFKLKPKSVDVAAGATETVRLKFRKNKNTVKKVKRLLRKGGKKARKRAKVVVKATATNAGGADSAKQKIRLKK
jgi:hypothetical protein